MITKFPVLYVGQIEMDDAAGDGTLAPSERLVEAFQTAKEVAQQIGELGYYCLWTAEHHFQHESYKLFPPTPPPIPPPGSHPLVERPQG